MSFLASKSVYLWFRFLFLINDTKIWPLFLLHSTKDKSNYEAFAIALAFSSLLSGSIAKSKKKKLFVSFFVKLKLMSLYNIITKQYKILYKIL